MTNESLDAALTQEPLFQLLPLSSQQAMRSKMIVRSYEAKQNVYGFDDTPVGLYFLFKGGLRVEWPGHHDVKAGHFYTPGSWFGQLSSMTETNRLVTVVSSTDSLIAFIKQSNVKKLIDTDPEIMRHLGRITQARLKTAIEIVADLMIRDTQQRLIATLIRLSGISNPLYQRKVYEVYYSQEELAGMANVTRTVANTILKRLERDELIKISYRRIQVTDPNGLKNMLLMAD